MPDRHARGGRAEGVYRVGASGLRRERGARLLAFGKTGEPETHVAPCRKEAYQRPRRHFLRVLGRWWTESTLPLLPGRQSPPAYGLLPPAFLGTVLLCALGALCGKDSFGVFR